MTDVEAPKSGMEENDTYLNNFNGDRRKRALCVALKMRDFEHEMYWKRAAFGWGLIAVAFGGFFSLKVGEHDFATRYAVACLCFLVSVAWLCLNRAGAHWQDNWESHVENLENEIIGPLFKMVMNPGLPSRFNIWRSFPYSPRRINNLLASTFALIGLMLMLRTAYTASPPTAPLSVLSCLPGIFASASFLVLTTITAASTTIALLCANVAPLGRRRVVKDYRIRKFNR